MRYKEMENRRIRRHKRALFFSKWLSSMLYVMVGTVLLLASAGKFNALQTYGFMGVTFIGGMIFEKVFRPEKWL